MVHQVGKTLTRGGRVLVVAAWEVHAHVTEACYGCLACAHMVLRMYTHDIAQLTG